MLDDVIMEVNDAEDIQMEVNDAEEVEMEAEEIAIHINNIYTIGITETDASGNRSVTFTLYENTVPVYTKTLANFVLNTRKIVGIDLADDITKAELQAAIDFATKQDKIDAEHKLPYNLISDTPTIPTKTSDLQNDSGYIDKDVNNLTNYPKTTEMNTAIQNHHDSSKQDVIDAEHKLSADLVKNGTTNKVVTQSEKDTWSGKQDKIDSSHKLSADLTEDGETNKTVTQAEKNTWSGKQDAIDNEHKLSSDLVDDTDKTNKFVTQAQKNAINTALQPNDNVSALQNDAGYLTEHQSLSAYRTSSDQDIIDATKENTSNKVTSISSASTNTQYPSAKCVYDIVGNIEATLQAIRGV